MADRPHLPRIEFAHQLEHDGRRGRLAVALEQAPLRQDEVDAGRLDPADGPDRAGELAFERPQVIHVLHEVGGGERVPLVEDLVADPALGRQALAREVHAQARQIGAGRHDGLPHLSPGLVADAARIEIADHRGRILHRQVGEQHAHIGPRHAQDEEGEEADERQRHRRHRGEPGRAELRNEIDDRLHGWDARDAGGPGSGPLGRNCPVCG